MGAAFEQAGRTMGVGGSLHWVGGGGEGGRGAACEGRRTALCSSALSPDGRLLGSTASGVRIGCRGWWRGCDGNGRGRGAWSPRRSEGAGGVGAPVRTRGQRDGRWRLLGRPAVRRGSTDPGEPPWVALETAGGAAGRWLGLATGGVPAAARAAGRAAAVPVGEACVPSSVRPRRAGARGRPRRHGGGRTGSGAPRPTPPRAARPRPPER